MRLGRSSRVFTIVLASVSVVACQHSRPIHPGVVPQPPALSADAIGAMAPTGAYIIGPEDILSIHVFREPDLSQDAITVDGAGRIDMPLIGGIDVSGKSPEELSHEIQRRYSERYLTNPVISVNIVKISSKHITVEGAVQSPGVFSMTSQSDLVSSLAMAGGTTDVSKLSQIAIFRKVNGRDMVAVFDLTRIRAGEMANPVILPGDIVVVGFSALNELFQNFLKTVPLISVFRPFQ